MPKLTDDEKDIARRVAKNKARIKAEWNKPDPLWPDRFKELEAALLKAHPHLAEQQFCKLIVETADDAPKKSVKLPNGIIIQTSWYKPPTTFADARKASAENKWLLEQARALR